MMVKKKVAFIICTVNEWMNACGLRLRVMFGDLVICHFFFFKIHCVVSEWVSGCLFFLFRWSVCAACSFFFFRFFSVMLCFAYLLPLLLCWRRWWCWCWWCPCRNGSGRCGVGNLLVCGCEFFEFINTVNCSRLSNGFLFCICLGLGNNWDGFVVIRYIWVRQKLRVSSEALLLSRG